MRSVYVREKLDDARALMRRRGAGLLMALAVELLVIIGLLTLWPPRLPRFGGEGNKTFQLFNAADDQKSADRQKQPQKRQQQQQRKASERTPTPPQSDIVPPTPPPVITSIPGMLMLNRQDYAATDISRIHNKPQDQGQAQGDTQLADSGADGDSEAVGRAPNGEPLYRAEWYREPTDAQLGFYLPHNMADGAAGLIACKTAPRFKVVDCVSLGETPPGSGMARGVLNAAWQFQVLPPRKGGHPIIGAWVQIRIDIAEKKRR